MEETVNQRIIMLKNDLQLTDMEFCSKAKMSTYTLHRIKNGQEITPKVIAAVSIGLNARYDWLLNGKGEKYNQAKDTPPAAQPDLWQDATYKIQQDQIKTLNDQIQSLKEEAKKAWALAQHFSGGTLNFPKPSKEPGSAHAELLEAA